MEQELELIRDQQKLSWDTFSPGWKKWDEFTMNFLKPSGDVIIRELKLQKNDNVLDVATGTGEPGLTIARLVPEGSVKGVDISEGMLSIAKEHAKDQGINNYTVAVSDITELPFPDGHFDAISCRMGYMFFPDMLLAAKEMFRVLKSGGRMSTSVWGGPDRNPWVTAMTGSIKKHMDIQMPPPGAPGMFRCADSNMMQSVLKQAGFKDIKVEDVPGKIDYETADRYWQSMNELAAPVVAAMSKADAATKEKIHQEVNQKLKELCPDGHVELNYFAYVLTGIK